MAAVTQYIGPYTAEWYDQNAGPGVVFDFPKWTPPSIQPQSPMPPQQAGMNGGLDATGWRTMDIMVFIGLAAILTLLIFILVKK